MERASAWVARRLRGALVCGQVPSEAGTEFFPGGQSSAARGGGAWWGEGAGEPWKAVGCGHPLSKFLLMGHHCFSEQMAFVGFKGSFRPTWVTLDTEDHGAKIFQVVPIPVVRKKKL